MPTDQVSQETGAGSGEAGVTAEARDKAAAGQRGKGAGRAASESGKMLAEQQSDVRPTAAPSLSAAEQAPASPLAAVGAEEEQDARVAEAVPSPETRGYPEQQVTIAQLKEKIMATTPNNTENTRQVTDAINDAQNRAKAAYDKGSEAVGELTDFAKGNVEAVVESSKIIASGMQEIGRVYAEEAKAAYEQMTNDLKELAAVKSPTELFQLQSKIMRRNFDALVAASSKNSEAMMKLANEAFAPLSGRVNAAAEKMSKVS